MEKKETLLSSEDITLINGLIKKLEDVRKKALEKYNGNEEWTVTFGKYPLEIKIYDMHISYLYLIIKLSSHFDSIKRSKSYNAWLNKRKEWDMLPKDAYANFIKGLRKEKDILIQRLEELEKTNPKDISDKVFEDHLYRQAYDDALTKDLTMRHESSSISNIGLKTVEAVFNVPFIDDINFQSKWKYYNFFKGNFISSYLGVGTLDAVMSDSDGFIRDFSEIKKLYTGIDRFEILPHDIKRYGLPRFLDEWNLFKKSNSITIPSPNKGKITNFDSFDACLDKAKEAYDAIISFENKLLELHPADYFTNPWYHIDFNPFEFLVPNENFSPYLFCLRNYFHYINHGRDYSYTATKWNLRAATDLSLYYRDKLEQIFRKQGLGNQTETIDKLIMEAEQVSKDMSRCDKIDYYLNIIAQKYEELIKSSQSSLLNVLNAHIGQLNGKNSITVPKHR